MQYLTYISKFYYNYQFIQFYLDYLVIFIFTILMDELYRLCNEYRYFLFLGFWIIILYVRVSLRFRYGSCLLRILFKYNNEVEEEQFFGLSMMSDLWRKINEIGRIVMMIDYCYCYFVDCKYCVGLCYLMYNYEFSYFNLYLHTHHY